ncbi:hypothetical protein V8F33_008493 [Rhypophila sp. PSN 637]
MQPFLELEQVPPSNSLLEPGSLPEPDLDQELTQESIPASALAPGISDSETGTLLSATSARASLYGHGIKLSCDYKDLTGQPCNKRFSRIYDLIRHQKSIHSTSLIVHCSRCEASFKREDALLRHTRAQHTNQGAQQRRNGQARRSRKPRKKRERV